MNKNILKPPVIVKTKNEVTTFPWNVEYCTDEELNKKYVKMADGRIRKRKLKDIV